MIEKIRLIPLFLLICFFAFTDADAQQQYERFIEAEHAAVSTAHPVASTIAAEILKNGGNAVDAAIAAGYAIGVLEPSGSGIGGGGTAIIYIKEEDRFYNLDFYPRAPARPIRNFDPASDVNTIRSVAVPGFVHGMEVMRERWASLDRELLISPSVEIARKGFVPDSVIHHILSISADKLRLYEESRELFTVDGEAPPRDFVIKNPKLAELMEAIITNGADAFYKSERTASIVQKLQNLGGTITTDDFAAFETRFYEPLTGSYYDYEIISAAPPQSGALIIQTLQMMEAAGIREAGDYRTDADAMHLLFEIFKRSYADRLAFLGDRTVVDVPLEGKLSKAYAQHRVSEINRSAAFPQRLRDTEPGNAFAFEDVAGISRADYEITWTDGDYEGASSYDWWGDDLFDSYGSIRRDARTGEFEAADDTIFQSLSDTLGIFDDRGGDDDFDILDESQTSHISIIDKDGNMVSFTTTIGHYYGSGITVDGVIMNSAMANFGTTNPVNLVGSNRTPRSTIAPTILTRDGKPSVIIGAAGGGRIPAAIVLGIHNMLDLGMNAYEANEAPRFISRRWADFIEMESRFSDDLIRNMERRGHPLYVRDPMEIYFGGMQIIRVRDDGVIEASSDPRRDGAPAGY